MRKLTVGNRNPIAEQAERIAASYGVPAGDARLCLTRLVDFLAQPLLDDPEDLDGAFFSAPLSLFEDALGCLPSDQVVRLFRDTDLERLSQRVLAFGKLVIDEAPFFTQEELAGHAHDFAAFLDRHRDYLVKTGLPPACFRACGWLHIHLGRLYPTRKARRISPGHDDADVFSRRDRSISTGAPHKWVKSLGFDQREDCPYDDADFLFDMKEGDVACIERERGRFLDAKLRIARELSRLTFQTDPNEFWQRCLLPLTDTFNSSELAFWLRMDEFYVDELDSRDIWNRYHAPGGLFNIFLVIGRYEAERRMKTFTQAKLSLGRLITELQARDYADYFSVLRRNDSSLIDAALDEFGERSQAENSFWEDYHDRVSLALGRDVRVQTPIELPSRRHVRELRATLQTDANALATKLSRGELLGESSPNRAIFRKDGNSWTISFAGKLVGKPDSAGLRHVA